MAHNPILEQTKLGRFDTPQVKRQQQGVLYKNNRYERTLMPGETMSRRELITGGWTFYIIDCSPHTITWRVDLPSQNRRELFPLSIELTYKVNKGHKLVDNDVTDVEKLIEQKLKRELRQITRTYSLKEHYALEDELEESLEDTDFFEEYGLVREASDVVLCFSDEELARIGGANLPKQIKRQVSLPTSEPLYSFDASISMQYKVTNEKLFPKAIEDAVQWLWEAMVNALQTVSIQYAVNQLNEAQIALREKLKNQRFAGDGVEITTVLIAISLDERARKHALELDEIAHAGLVDEAQDHQKIAKFRRMIAFYEQYLPPDMKLTALGMSADEMTIREVMESLDEKRLEQLNIQMSMLQELIKADALPETIAEKAAEALMGTLSGYALSSKQLPGIGKEQLALKDKNKTDKDANQSDGKSDDEEPDPKQSNDQGGSEKDKKDKAHG